MGGVCMIHDLSSLMTSSNFPSWSNKVFRLCLIYIVLISVQGACSFGSYACSISSTLVFSSKFQQGSIMLASTQCRHYYLQLFVSFLYYSVIQWLTISRAIRHPASGYVQGINDLLTPFLVVFLSEHLEGNMDTWSMEKLSPQDVSNIEADCYWCLSKFLDGMQDHYTFAQPGIQRLVFRLKELVHRIDGNVPPIQIFMNLFYC